MKTSTKLILISQLMLSILFVNAQTNSLSPYSFTHSLNNVVPLISMPAHDFTEDITNAEAFEKAGNYPIISKHFDINTTTQNSGIWTTLQNGDRLWQLRLKSNGALSTGVFYDNFYLPEGSALSVYSPDHAQVFNYSFEDNQGNYLFSTEFIKGDEQIIEYFEPASVKGKGSMQITALAHQFRTIMADPCEVNVVCSPEGTGWQDIKKGVCRLYVVSSAGGGYCTGTLVNNTALNCKRYILTAYHCGGGATQAQYNQWVFRFNFEATQCTGQADTYGTATNQFTGCSQKAGASDSGGSDFLLLEMTSTTSPSWWASTAFYNGWTKSTTASPSPIGIHHPAGSNKKISAVNGTPTTGSYPGAAGNAHWRVTWKATTNGYGVTEGGSSGSSLFTSTGLIMGTLTGGGSFCTSPTSPDYYGKLSYHWASNGTTSATQLKAWLDPTNSGVTTLTGGFSPCNSIGINENQEDNKFTVFPNPNNGAFTLAFELNKEEDVTFRVLDVIGKEVYSKNVMNTIGGNYTIDLSSKANGIYFVELRTKASSSLKKINIVK